MGEIKWLDELTKDGCEICTVGVVIQGAFELPAYMSPAGQVGHALTSGDLLINAISICLYVSLKANQLSFSAVQCHSHSSRIFLPCLQYLYMSCWTPDFKYEKKWKQLYPYIVRVYINVIMIQHLLLTTHFFEVSAEVNLFGVMKRTANHMAALCYYLHLISWLQVQMKPFHDNRSC